MNVILKKTGSKGRFTWCADRPDLPGSPTVGYGRTRKEALGDLLFQAQREFGLVINLSRRKG